MNGGDSLDDCMEDALDGSVPVWAAFGDLMAGALGAFALILVAALGMQMELSERLRTEHLPDIGKGQVVMDSGELVGVLSPRMATNVDARIGVTVTRKARGV